MKTEAAQAAAMLRKEIKAMFPEVRFTCTSENYAGGSSIRVRYEDQPKDVHNAIKGMASKYQYGHFDGMNDIYEYSNVKTGLPQAKYVFTDNQMSDIKREEIYQNIRARFGGGDDLPPLYEDGRNHLFQGQWVSQMVWQEFMRGW